jgi:glycosyltransferase involved in cell wall biosynthesis
MQRLAIVVSHPIQYHAVWYRSLARVTDLEVFFCHHQAPADQAAAGFDVEFEWDVPLLDGYNYTWLENRAVHPDVSRFSGCDTPQIGAILRARRFDACLVSGWYLKSYIQAIFACRREGIHLLSRGESQLATRRSVAWTTAKWLPYRWLLGRIDAHLYIGAANLEYLRHYGVPDSRLFFAPYFVDNAFFHERAADARQSGRAASIRTALGIPERACVFVFVGKLISRKRPADLVRALALARHVGSHAWLLVVGSGALQPALESLAQELNVPARFVGFRNQSEVPDYLAAADALVLPSDATETWGLVVNEAMACGLPAVVSTAAGCCRDLVDDSRTGFRFDAGDCAALADALMKMERALASSASVIRGSVASRIAGYSCDRAVEGLLEALEFLPGMDRSMTARITV